MHRRTVEQRAAKMTKLRTSVSGWRLKDVRGDKIADDAEVVVLAAVVCCGFLAFLEDSVRNVREVIGKSLEVPVPPEAKG